MADLNDDDADMLFEEFDDPGFENEEESEAPVVPLSAPSPPFWDVERRNGRREAVRCVGEWEGAPEIRVLQNVLVTLPRELCQRAFAPSGRAVQNTRFGVLMVCNVLRRVHESDSDEAADYDEATDDDAHELLFEITKECVAIKVSFIQRMPPFDANAPQGVAENPWFELCGLDLIGRMENALAREAHAMRADLVIQDEFTNTLNVVMPFFRNGDMFDHIARSPTRRLPEDLARRWIHQILTGLYELKTLGIAHGDVKPENVLITNDGNCRLIDMGLITRVPYLEENNVDPDPDFIVANLHPRSLQWRRLLIQPNSARVGSLPYMPPEIWANRNHPLRPYSGEAMDVWSAGVTLFVMLTGVESYRVPDLHDQRFAAMTGNLNALFEELGIAVSPRCLDLLQRMLQRDPNNRIDFTQILFEPHPWFQNH